MARNVRETADFRLVAAVASGKPAAEIARETGVSERTLSRRLQEPLFQKQVAAARERAFENAINLLSDASMTAVLTLRALCQADSEQVRCSAAKALLDSSLRWREQVTLAQDVAMLMAERDKQHRWG